MAIRSYVTSTVPNLFLSPASAIELDLPTDDNSSEALSALLAANAQFRTQVWPPPFDSTDHLLHLGDARSLGWIPTETVHLVVTSPPYWNLKQYASDCDGQLAEIENYESFLDQLDAVWEECHRVLVKGGRVCCVVGDICVPRRKAGRHYVLPLHADIEVRARRLGFDCLTPILWHKIANGATEADGNGNLTYGKPYQPGAIVKNDIEYILFLRKGGSYRSASPLQKALSMLSKDEMHCWLSSIWTDVPGASTRHGHPAPFPIDIPERLIRLFSFAGDTILDPFVGIGSTMLAALKVGRNSIGNEIEPNYTEMAAANLYRLAAQERTSGAINANIRLTTQP